MMNAQLLPAQVKPIRATLRRQQSGLVLALLAVVLAVIASTYIFSVIASTGLTDVVRAQTSIERMEKIRAAVVTYVAIYGNVPCGADGTSPTDAGTSIPTTTYTCSATAQTGTVPWQTLNLPQTDSYDGWGRKVSYRVYTGDTGVTAGTPLLLPPPADMTQCDSAGGTATLSAPNYLCDSGTRAPDSSFMDPIIRPGLIVSDQGRTFTQVALVLVSHGATGNGAWLGNGLRSTMPPNSNTAERDNANSTGPFWIKTASDKSVDAGGATHFDDRVVYMTIRDLIVAAGRGARDWP